MKVWRFYRFDEGAHWDTALVEASTSEEARGLLAAHLDENEIDTMWSRQPVEDWQVEEAVGPVLFVMGAGCR